MIPQMLSSPSSATGRTVPPPSETTRDPRPRDADKAAFTLAAEDTGQDAPGGIDTQMSLPFDAEPARASMASAREDTLAITAGPAPDNLSDAALREKVSGEVPHGEATVIRRAATTATTTAAAATEPPPRRAVEDAVPKAAGSPRSSETPPGAATAESAASRPDARNAAAAVPAAQPIVAATRAPDPEWRDRLPSIRGAAPSPGGNPQMSEVPPSAGRAPDGAAQDTVKASGPAPTPPATAADDSAMMSTDRFASYADAGTSLHDVPRDVEVARTESGRTDALRAEPPRTDLARAVGNQLVEAVRHGPGGSTDVALNPEELGRVRLSLMAQDGVLHVTVLAERPETHDLLRRNIGLLQSDFRALGYTDVAFDFGPGGDRPDRPAEPAPIFPDAPSETLVAAPDPHTAHQRATAATARLDLRL